MIKTYQYRIYPTPQQEELFKKTMGLKRLYWNLALGEKNKNHDYKLKSYKDTFTDLKSEALEWCKEVDSTALATTWNDLTQAFRNFFASVNKSRKGKFVKPPKFKSKKNCKDSITYTAMVRPKFIEGKLFITRKIGLLDGAYHCRFAEGKFKTVAIKRTNTNKWFVSIVVDKKEEYKNTNNKAVGIDWNCRDDVFLTLSNGTIVKCPRFLRRKEYQLKKYQQILSNRFVKGKEVQSNNYYKMKFKVAKLYEKVSNQRLDWLHKLSRNLCNSYQYIVVEDINLQQMQEKLNHGKTISDQGFGILRNLITYKGNLIKVSAKNTSKTCSHCGFVNNAVVLGVEEWTCPNCNTNHHRDINAANNILIRGMNILGLVGGEPAEIDACEKLQESPESSACQ